MPGREIQIQRAPLVPTSNFSSPKPPPDSGVCKFPVASAAPVAPRPVAPAPPARKSPCTSSPAHAKPPVTAKPVPRLPLSTSPVKPTAPPPRSPARRSLLRTPHRCHSEPVPWFLRPAPVAPAPRVADPEPANPRRRLTVARRWFSTRCRLPALLAPPSQSLLSTTIRRKFSALFAVPHRFDRISEPLPSATGLLLQPSTEELKLQAARLQAQLSSLLFRGTASPAAPPALQSQNFPLRKSPRRFSKFLRKIPSPLCQASPNRLLRPLANRLLLLSASDEEVKIPSWLAPLSQNSEPAAADSDCLD